MKNLIISNIEASNIRTPKESKSHLHVFGFKLAGADVALQKRVNLSYAPGSAQVGFHNLQTEHLTPSMMSNSGNNINNEA